MQRWCVKCIANLFSETVIRRTLTKLRLEKSVNSKLHMITHKALRLVANLGKIEVNVISRSPVKSGMELLTHSQNSAADPLKFANV